ncbi:MAG: hypothetical protein Tp1111DCM1126091_35 [Prokaryotic dsDNA virus sp.]|nr:MAG: hypothetical protein Tp1111DCM1126091_35 [Prokaryotic dsDNA virus sp.]|tara:strand:+ start:85337 stop:85513 length:177 start_codon:yes stop_codon:yes gene_type:complete
MDILFSVNTYDSGGDIEEEGVFLHFEDTRVRVADKPEDFVDVVYQIRKIQEELLERYK